MKNSMMREQTLDDLVVVFLTDLAHANRSPHTHHAYAADLAQLCAFHQGPVQAITVGVLRTFFRMHLHLSPATRARKQAAVARFLIWAYQEDIDLSLDNEHLTIVGKGGKRRTLLLDDPRLVQQIRAYLTRPGYKHGPLFRAEKNGRGGPLRYQSMQERWDHYCTRSGVVCTLHQLRHTHATELINGGVSLPTIRKRLGHKNVQTTVRYAEQTDKTADAEGRVWRRRIQDFS